MKIALAMMALALAFFADYVATHRDVRQSRSYDYTYGDAWVDHATPYFIDYEADKPRDI